MTDSSLTPAPWWDFEHAHPTGNMILISAFATSIVALLAYKMASLLYFNHKLVFLLGPILLFVSIYLAWYAFHTVRAILSARTQSGRAEPLQQQKALDALRRYSLKARVTALVVLIFWWLVTHPHF